MTTRIVIVGLGYVGIQLAVEFGKHLPTLGYDRDSARVADYVRGRDAAGEVSGDQFAAATHLQFTDDAADISGANVYIIAVPTPVDAARQPDFGPLIGASRVVGKAMTRGATVVYESTVYPGATEEVCVRELETASGLVWRDDFNVAYSPERINPGDVEHTLTRIVKVVAADSAAALDEIAALYELIISAGVYRAASIQVAEAAKVIENTQRDLNIALINELAIIFHRLGIDTGAVLDAAGTKWNFLPFRPGLVGGHCIGVDPYYLTHKAEAVGHHPEVILAGRRINDGMGRYVARETVKELVAAGFEVRGARVVVAGLTFKENCSDLRNSQVVPLVDELRSFGLEVMVHDPVALAAQAREEYAVDLIDWEALPTACAVVLAVPHAGLLSRGLAGIAAKLETGGCVIDIKSVLDPEAVRAAGYRLWRL